MKKENLSDEKVNVKISTCNICGGIVTAAVGHLMSTKDKNAFAKEAMKYNLNIKTQSLIEYRKENAKFCTCK